MNALKRVFKAQGLDEIHSDLYKKLEIYDEILLAPEIQNIKKSKSPAILFGALAIALIGGAIGVGVKKANTKEQIDTAIRKSSIDEFVKSTKNNG